jgi:hypothetical protein
LERSYRKPACGTANHLSISWGCLKEIAIRQPHLIAYCSYRK